jgi:hypothetical protein
MSGTKVYDVRSAAKTGEASLSQDNDDAPTVQSVSDGFKVVATQYGPDFQCTTCNLAVVP